MTQMVKRCFSLVVRTSASVECEWELWMRLWSPFPLSFLFFLPSFLALSYIQLTMVIAMAACIHT